jgi:hypothetical protein
MIQGTLDYQETGLTTTDTKFAATLLMFGFKLKQHNPLTWKLVFNSKAQYLDWYQKAKRENEPTETADWNFEASSPQIFQYLYRGFTGKEAGETLSQVIERLIPDPKDRKGIQFLIDACIAQSCREVLERREFLMRLLKTVPRDARWIFVNNGGKTAMFGINANVETQTFHLSNI